MTPQHDPPSADPWDTQYEDCLIECYRQDTVPCPKICEGEWVRAFRTARRHLAQQDAEDVAGEYLLRLVRTFRTKPCPPEAIASYLTEIIRNLVNNQFRKQRTLNGRIAVVNFAQPDVDATAGTVPEPADQRDDAYEGPSMDHILDLIERPVDREIVRLRYVEGLTADKIAARLSLPSPNAVNIRLTKIRQALGKILDSPFAE